MKPASCPANLPSPMRVDTGFESHRTSASRTSSGALLQGARELIIEHAGREYRLRVTASGKLILTA